MVLHEFIQFFERAFIKQQVHALARRQFAFFFVTGDAVGAAAGFCFGMTLL